MSLERRKLRVGVNLNTEIMAEQRLLFSLLVLSLQNTNVINRFTITINTHSMGDSLLIGNFSDKSDRDKRNSVVDPRVGPFL